MDSGVSSALSDWLSAVEVFNGTGSFEAVLALMADDVVWDGVGNSRAEIAPIIEQAKAAGWCRFETLSLTQQGPLVVNTGRNHFTDGTSHVVAGISVFNAEGKIIKHYTTGPDDAQGT